MSEETRALVARITKELRDPWGRIRCKTWCSSNLGACDCGSVEFLADLRALLAVVEASAMGAMRGPLRHIATLQRRGSVMLGVEVKADALAHPIRSGDIYEIRKVADFAAHPPTETINDE